MQCVGGSNALESALAAAFCGRVGEATVATLAGYRNFAAKATTATLVGFTTREKERWSTSGHVGGTIGND